MKRVIGVAMVLAMPLILGCGGASLDEPGEEGPAIELTRYLPPGGAGYEAVDISAVKRGLDLSPSTSILSLRRGSETTLNNFAQTEMSAVYATNARPLLLDALDLPAVTAAALTSISTTSPKEQQPVAVFATSADTARIESRLRGMGFVDRGGVFEGPDRRRATGFEVRSRSFEVKPGSGLGELSTPRAAMAVRFDDGRLLVSPDADLLRAAPTDPGDLPLEVENHLGGDAMVALGPQDCELGMCPTSTARGELCSWSREEPTH